MNAVFLSTESCGLTNEQYSPKQGKINVIRLWREFLSPVQAVDRRNSYAKSKVGETPGSENVLIPLRADNPLKDRAKCKFIHDDSGHRHMSAPEFSRSGFVRFAYGPSNPLKYIQVLTLAKSLICPGPSL